MYSAFGHDRGKEPSAAIKAVSFDADDTLWDFRQVTRRSHDTDIQPDHDISSLPELAGIISLTGPPS